MKRICHAAVLTGFIFLYVVNAFSNCFVMCLLTYIAFTSCAFAVISVTGAFWMQAQYKC